MISFAVPLPIGNAVRILWAPPVGTLRTRLLRKLTDDIADQTDANALVAFEGADTSFVDVQALTNGTSYFYRAFYFDGQAWTGSPSVSATPAATATVAYADPLVLVRDRLAAGLKIEVQAGRLVHDTGAIPCLTAPPAYEGVKFPIVTVHLRQDAPSVRAVGELAFPDFFDDVAGHWVAAEGWLSQTSLDVVCWALNPDERIALRQAVKKVIAGNLPVFDQAGMVQIEFSQTDVEDFESYGAPVYQTINSLSCLAPVLVTAVETVIDVVSVTATAA